MPLHDLLEDALASGFDHISMTRHDPVEIPRPNPQHTLIERGSIRRTQSIPNRPLLPQRRALGTLQPAKNLGQNARGGVDGGFGELFGGGEVEEEIAFDEGFGGFVQEDEFFVRVAVDVFGGEGGVEFGIDGDGGGGGGEEVPGGFRELEVFLFGAQGGQGVGGEDFCVGVCLFVDEG